MEGLVDLFRWDHNLDPTGCARADASSDSQGSSFFCTARLANVIALLSHLVVILVQPYLCKYITFLTAHNSINLEKNGPILSHVGVQHHECSVKLLAAEEAQDGVTEGRRVAEVQDFQPPPAFLLSPPAVVVFVYC